MTAKQCSKSPAELIGIEDPEIAFAFNQECAEMFYLYEQEQETKRIEGLFGMGLVGNLGTPANETSAANLRDQSW